MIKEYIDKLSDENQQYLESLRKQMRQLLEEQTCAEEWSETLQIENSSQINIFSPRNIDSEINQKLERAANNIASIKQQIESVKDLIETHLQKQEEYEKLLEELEKSEEEQKKPLAETTKLYEADNASKKAIYIRKKEFQNLEESENAEEDAENSDLLLKVDYNGKNEENTEYTGIAKKANDTDINVFGFLDNKNSVEKEHIINTSDKDGGDTKKSGNAEIQTTEQPDLMNTTKNSISEYERSNQKEVTENLKNISEFDFSTYQTEVLMPFLSELYKKAELCLVLLNDRNKCRRELNQMKNSIKEYADKLKNESN